ncbi:uncharacterized protein [Halyomorpha halys]|uniref:uncharacterized protein n=1 Tax=Halyomorpha halys TaxID=286706 RepID=UPI0034D2B0D8
MHGKLVTEKKDVLEVWRQFLQRKFSMEERLHHNYRNCRRRGRVEDTYPEDMDDAIGEDEVELAANKIQLGKASGPDGTAPEFIKYGGNEIIKCLQMLFQKIWDHRFLSREREDNIIIPIHKKGNQSECGN